MSPVSTTAGGYDPGWTLGSRFEGSRSSDGSVYDVSTAAGYNFSRHFAADFGVPIFFVGTPSSIQQSNPGAASGVGIGDIFGDLRLNLPAEQLNSVSTIHFTAPTGDTGKGFRDTSPGTPRTISTTPLATSRLS